MAYTIHKVDRFTPGTPADLGPMLASGQTRAQVLRACVQVGLLRSEILDHPMPRFGRALIVCEPGGDFPFMIWHH